MVGEDVEPNKEENVKKNEKMKKKKKLTCQCSLLDVSKLTSTYPLADMCAYRDISTTG